MISEPAKQDDVHPGNQSREEEEEEEEALPLQERKEREEGMSSIVPTAALRLPSSPVRTERRG